MNWRRNSIQPALVEVHRSIPVPAGAGFLRKLFAFAGPGYLVAVGYMDPGNWATDIAGGSAFGYALLSVIMLSNLMAILLQALALRLGIVTRRDLAQACHDHYSRPVSLVLWVLAEIAIIACDMAEVIGTAIALNLLFGLPLPMGVLASVLTALIVLSLQSRGFRYIEALVVSLMAVVIFCFLYQIILAQPVMSALLAGFIPTPEIITNPQMLYIAIGILGATVMPHNLYLHSAIVQTRSYEPTVAGKREAIRFATIDSTVALMLALFVNAAILIVAAATFHTTGHADIAEIQEAHGMLEPLLGSALAATLFGVALLFCGLNSTLTATLAGQIIMEGFIKLRMSLWQRQLITRSLAIIPTLLVTLHYGESGTAQLLVFSQVVLSLQLPFAVIPLVLFTSNKGKMGEFASTGWMKYAAFTVAALIVGLNMVMLYYSFSA